MKNNVEQAVARFKEGFSCSQAVLSTFGPQLGLDRDLALRVAGAFGGGMGRMGGTCGAVTGAFMVIGLKHGETKETAYEHVREFVKRFTSMNGTIVCKELLGCDLSTPEGLTTALEKKLFVTVCPKFVRDASEILEQIL